MAPTGLTASAVGSGRVDLAWTDASTDETGFEVERSATSATAGFALLATPAADATAHADVTVVPGTAYWYRLRAVDAHGTSPWSAVATATTPGPPPAPTGLVAFASGGTHVNLAWSSTAATHTGFELERSATSDAAGFTPVVTVSPAATGYADAGLTPLATYWYRVRAVGAGGASAWSNVATVLMPPAQPTGLLASASGPSSVDLGWAPVAGASGGYWIEFRDVTHAGGWMGFGYASTNAAAVTGLTQSTAYELRVTAQGPGGASDPSAPVAVSTPSGLAAPPATVTAVATAPDTVVVTWTAAAGADGYWLEVRDATHAGGWQGIGTVTGTSFTQAGLSQGTTYEYRVSSMNSYGMSGPSQVASATTPMVPSPTGLVATATGPTTVDLAWNAVPQATGGYWVELRDATHAGGWMGFGFAATPAVTVTGLAQSTTYQFRVYAQAPSGQSGPSQVATATTPSGLAPPPAQVTAVAADWRTVDVTWTASPGADVSYWFEYRDATHAGGWIALGTVVATAHQVTGLAPATAYEFRVSAMNVFGMGDPSAPAGATTPRIPTPTGLAAVPVAPGAIDVTWTPTPGAGVDSVVEWRDATHAGGWIPVFGLVGGTYTIAGLAQATTYEVRVSAMAGGYLSDPTAAQAVTTPMLPSPTSLVATPTSASTVDLTWNPVDGATLGYWVEFRSVAGGSGWTSWSFPQTTGDTVQFLNPSSTYQFRVSASAPSGMSTPSAVASATTPAGP